MMFTVTLSDNPEHVMLKRDLIVIGTDWLPEGAEEERFGPEMVQEDTSFELHEMRDELPECTRVGLAEMLTSGASTSTEANAVADCAPCTQVTW